MRTLKLAVYLVACSALGAYAQDHGSVAIQSELRLLRMNDFVPLFTSSAMPVFGPSCELGIRAFVADRFGLECNFGLVANTGVKSDVATSTDEMPSSFSMSFIGGLVGEIAQGERAALALIGRGGAVIGKTYEADFGVGETKYATWLSVSPRFFVGLEPSLNLSRNLALFSNVGVMFVVIPNSKYIDPTDPSYDFNAGEFPLKERKDAFLSMGIDGLCLGMRYYF